MMKIFFGSIVLVAVLLSTGPAFAGAPPMGAPPAAPVPVAGAIGYEFSYHPMPWQQYRQRGYPEEYSNLSGLQQFGSDLTSDLFSGTGLDQTWSAVVGNYLPANIVNTIANGGPALVPGGAPWAGCRNAGPPGGPPDVHWVIACVMRGVNQYVATLPFAAGGGPAAGGMWGATWCATHAFGVVQVLQLLYPGGLPVALVSGRSYVIGMRPQYLLAGVIDMGNPMNTTHTVLELLIYHPNGAAGWIEHTMVDPGHDTGAAVFYAMNSSTLNAYAAVNAAAGCPPGKVNTGLICRSARGSSQDFWKGREKASAQGNDFCLQNLDRNNGPGCVTVGKQTHGCTLKQEGNRLLLASLWVATCSCSGRVCC